MRFKISNPKKRERVFFFLSGSLFTLLPILCIMQLFRWITNQDILSMVAFLGSIIVLILLFIVFWAQLKAYWLEDEKD